MHAGLIGGKHAVALMDSTEMEIKKLTTSQLHQLYMDSQAEQPIYFLHKNWRADPILRGGTKINKYKKFPRIYFI